MNPSIPAVSPVSRRAALKAFGASAAALAASLFAPRGLAAESKKEKDAAGNAAPAPAGPAVPSGPFTLPELGYAYNALEPAIDAMTMEIHYTRHHQAYINNANMTVKDYPDLKGMSPEGILRDIKKVPGAIQTAIRNNVGGHANHTLFWDILTPGGPKEPRGSLARAIGRDLESTVGMSIKLREAAMSRFGSGWSWLCVYNKKLSVFSTANQDSPLMDGATPILGIDVWEHAYYLKYQSGRANYVQAVLGAINWDKVGARFEAAMG